MKVSGLSSRTFSDPNLPFAQRALELGAKRGEAMVRRDAVHGHPADVVAVPGVFRARISQADPEFHVAASIRAGDASASGFAKARMPVSGCGHRSTLRSSDDRFAPDHARARDRRARRRAAGRDASRAERPGPGEVLVRIAASPINPSDLMTVQGLYGVDWTFPLIPGLEGSGRVVGRGDGLLARYLDGPPVACVADKQGLWAEYAVTKAARCLACPRTCRWAPRR
jgi:hypothetical protein